MKDILLKPQVLNTGLGSLV